MTLRLPALVRSLALSFGTLCLAATAAAQLPTIDAVTATDASSPTAVTLTGTNLGAGTSVTVGGVAATVVSATSTQLIVTFPPQDPGFADVVVANGGGQATLTGGLELWPALAATNTGLGGDLDYQLNTGAAGFVIVALGTGDFETPVPLLGADYGLLLDLGSPVVALQQGLLMAPDTVFGTLPIPTSASLFGLEFRIQALCQQQLDDDQLSFSNAVTIVLDQTDYNPPSDLVYPVNPAVYEVGEPIDPNTPTVSGLVEDFQVVINPLFGFSGLPAGLELDPETGTISGTPTEATSAQLYLVAASNAAGETATVLTLATPATAPTNLSYSDPQAQYAVGQAIVPNLPTVTGTVTDWSVVPNLPLGLTLDPVDGSITGAPLFVGGPTGHLITASNAGGSTNAVVTIEVVGDSTGELDLVAVSNGFGQLLPHLVFELNEGVPTQELVEIDSLQVLYDNVNANNRILPPAAFPVAAVLPNGSSGNHYLAVEFTAPIAISSVLTPDGSAPSQLTESLSLTAVDPPGGSTPISVQAFVGGRAYLNPDPLAPGFNLLESHVGFDTGLQKPVALTPQGEGFPFTQGGPAATGAAQLVAPTTLVLVADSDGDLTTHETFPAGVQIQLRFGSLVLSVNGDAFDGPALASSTVGVDVIEPEVGKTEPGSMGLPTIQPPAGAFNVDPATDVTIAFTDPVQPYSVGQVADGSPPALSPAIKVAFGPLGLATNVPFVARPASAFDLSTWTLDLAFDLPGLTAGAGSSCGLFSSIAVTVSPLQIEDLAKNKNLLAVVSGFETGEGPGLVNAPVAPDAVYVMRSNPGSVSVIDLNGFGAGTGNPAFDPADPIVKGNSNYPNNPNVAILGLSLVPPLEPGACTFNGGSAGVFTLTLDSNLNERLLASPTIVSVADMVLGEPLDVVFNAGPPPFGCQVGMANICASSALKQPNLTLDLGIVKPVLGGGSAGLPAGTGNLISWAPHPNPPALAFPPSCLSPLIGGQEPTSIASSGGANLLVPSADPLGNPALGIPPSGLLAESQNAYFVGPSLPPVSPGDCEPFQIRQQVGHFLYLADSARGEVVVVNSNRFLKLDAIPVEAPRALAMSPNLDLLAVASDLTGVLSFIDVNPSSPSFHQVVTEIALEPGIGDVVWQPDNEDVLVVNAATDELIVVSAFSLQVRKVIDTLAAGVSGPRRLAVTNRQTTFGHQRDVYFAFLVGTQGKLAVFESGPDGVGGWGTDGLLAVPGITLVSPFDLRIDPASLEGAIWVGHENPVEVGTGLATGQTGPALTRLELGSSVSGQLPLALSPATTLGDRALDLTVTHSVGDEVLSGTPVSISFDEQVNLGALPAVGTVFSPSAPAQANSKSLVRFDGMGSALPTRVPRFMFVAAPNAGVVDVIDLSGEPVRFDTDPFEPGTQSIPVQGAIGVVDWFGQ